MLDQDVSIRPLLWLYLYNGNIGQ